MTTISELLADGPRQFSINDMMRALKEPTTADPAVISALERAGLLERRVELTEKGRHLAGSEASPVKASNVILRPEDFAVYVLDTPIKGSRLEVIQKAVVTLALKRAGGNKSAAARLLGMDRKAFARRVRRT